MSSMKLALASVGLATALCLTGCSGSSPAAPQAGQCFAEEVKDGSDVAPDFGSDVPCTEPHVYEVIKVLPIPQKYLSGESEDEKLANRTELADVSDAATEEASAMREEIYPQCEPAVRKAVGLADLVAQGATADELGVTLAGQQTSWFNLTPPEQWTDGQTGIVCMIRYQSDSDDDGPQPLFPVTSPDDRPLITHYTDGSVWPTQLRTCFAPDDGDRIACDEPHVQESLFTLDARAAFGESFLRDADMTALDTSDLDMLRRLCGEVYGQLGYAPGEGREYGGRTSSANAGDSADLAFTCTLTSATEDPLGDYAAFTKN